MLSKGKPSLELNIGVFNKNGDFYLYPQDVEQAARYFQILNQNRQLYEHSQLLVRKEERAHVVQHSFRPFVDPKNNRLAERSRERQDDKDRAFSGARKHVEINLDYSQRQQSTEKRCVSPVVQRLTKPALSPRWVAMQRQQRLQESDRECTFKPQISGVQHNRSKEKANAIMKTTNLKINKGINLILGDRGRSGVQERTLSMLGAN